MKNTWLIHAKAHTDPQLAYHYAYSIVKNSWPKGEEAISKSDHYSYCYARYVIKGPWPKGEPIIKQGKSYWSLYCKHFNIKDI